VCSPQHLCGTLADDDAGSHGVAGRYARHNRPIRDAKVVDSVDFEIAVNHGHWISAHLGSAGLVPVTQGTIADEVFELLTFQVARHHFALGKPLKRSGVTYLAAKLHTGYCGLQIVRMIQKIRLNLNRVEGVQPGQTEIAPAFRPYDAKKQPPVTCPAKAYQVEVEKPACMIGLRPV
jgi:hypothetical protein